jgi:putative phage-type endonuclease
MLIPCKQGSAEWLQNRLARVTASRVKDVMDFLKKGGSSDKRRKYMAEIIAETLTGIATEHYVSPYMQWGIETEREARAAYEIESGNIVDQTGLFVHDSIPRFAASPDGLIGDDGLFEAKCPQTTTHLGWLKAGGVPEEHLPQVWAQLACTGRQWCDWVSFDPRLPEPLQLIIQRVHRDELKIDEVEASVLAFLEEVVAEINTLSDLVGGFEPKPKPPQGAEDTRTTEEWLADFSGQEIMP